jgi:trehalose 6-phosphate phosphatase
MTQVTAAPASLGVTGPHARYSASPPPSFARDWCFFLDVDGTLIDIAARPDAVCIEPHLLDLLADLNLAAGGALALISGRTLADLDRLFAPLAIACAGQHGAERRDAAGDLHLHPCRGELLRGAATGLAGFASTRPGLLFEDKGCNLALHFRAAPERQAEVLQAMLAALQALGSAYTLMEGKMVYEIKATGYDKGTVIDEFMQEPPFAGRVPVFIGDDTTDEYGFSVVNALGGHSLKVGPGKTLARWTLKDAATVRTWLAAWTIFSSARAAA